MIQTTQQQIVDEAMASRHSMRAFLPTPVSHEDIEKMFEVAARAPSGSNTQPWKAYVLTGAIKERLSNAIVEIYNDKARFEALKEDYRYYPTEWESPYIDRRRKVGLALYKLLGLGRDDKAGMRLVVAILTPVRRRPSTVFIPLSERSLAFQRAKSSCADSHSASPT